MNSTERYTIFVPTDAALNSVNADNLSITDLKNLLSFHIVKGNFIFTDGRLPMGAYRTLNNRLINIMPKPDKIQILRVDNSLLYNDLVLSPNANLIGMSLQNASESYYITNAVIHHINTVIMPY